MKNLKEDNKKLNSDEKPASQPELIVLRKTKLDKESVKKNSERFKGDQMICFKSS